MQLFVQLMNENQLFITKNLPTLYLHFFLPYYIPHFSIIVNNIWMNEWISSLGWYEELASKVTKLRLST